MRWVAPSPDPLLDKAWARLWPRQLLIFAGYFLVFCGLYWRMRWNTADEGMFFWNQRILSRQLLGVMGLHFLGFVLWKRKLWAYRWRRFFWAAESPYNLALVRILLCAFITTHLIFYVPENWLPLAGLPEEARRPLPLIGWLIAILPISPTLYSVALGLGIAAGTLATIGLWTRPALLALIPLVFYVFGVPQFYGKLSHYQFFFWVPVILAFTPCNRVWSMDALLARIRGLRISRKPSVEFGLGIRWLMLTLAGIYFFSGVLKLYEAGLYWAFSDNPVNLLRTEWLEQFDYLPWIRVDRWPWLCRIGALGVIFFEMSYPFLLLSPRGRIAAAIGAIGFHNLNGYFLKIDFVYLKTTHLGYFRVGDGVGWLRGFRQRWMAWLMVILSVGVLGGGVWVGFWCLCLWGFWVGGWGCFLCCRW